MKCIMKSKKKVINCRLYEYRIKYNAEESHVEINNYHYFMAKNAKEALDYHLSMKKKRKIKMQTLSIEKFNPYSLLWENESFILSQEA